MNEMGNLGLIGIANCSRQQMLQSPQSLKSGHGMIM